MSSISEQFKLNYMPGATENEYFERALEQTKELVYLLDMLKKIGLEESGIFYFLICTVRMGVMDDGVLSEQEERMIRYVFDKLLPDLVEDIINEVQDGDLEESYQRLSFLKVLGLDEMLQSAVNLALTFALVDGEIEEDTANAMLGLLAS